jgi:hypothetical protein
MRIALLYAVRLQLVWRAVASTKDAHAKLKAERRAAQKLMEKWHCCILHWAIHESFERLCGAHTYPTRQSRGPIGFILPLWAGLHDLLCEAAIAGDSALAPYEHC